jgi:hypothetical protein
MTTINLTNKKFKLQKTTIILIIGQIGDWLTTAWFLSLGGSEGNPIPYQYGWMTFILIQTVFTALFVLLMETVSENHFNYYQNLFNKYSIIKTVIRYTKWLIALYWCYPAIHNIFWMIIEYYNIHITI